MPPALPLEECCLRRRRRAPSPLAGIDLRDTALIQAIVSGDMVLILALLESGLNVGDVLRRQVFCGSH